MESWQAGSRSWELLGLLVISADTPARLVMEQLPLLAT